jgi:hypothetical protein
MRLIVFTLIHERMRLDFTPPLAIIRMILIDWRTLDVYDVWGSASTGHGGKMFDGRG